MKAFFLLGLALLFVIPSQNLLRAAPPQVPLAPDPPELVAAREAFKAALVPLRAKVDESQKALYLRYTAALQPIEDGLTKAGKFEAIPALRAERTAYAAGTSTSGFSEKDKTIPSAARELRRALDRDVAKISSDAAPMARPLVADYAKQLDALDRKFTSARNADGALAVRKEKAVAQGSAVDPFGASDDIVVGKWADKQGNIHVFLADGTVSVKSSTGKWKWTSRSRRSFRLDWDGSNAFIDLTVAPNGMTMSGPNRDAHVMTFTRK